MSFIFFQINGVNLNIKLGDSNNVSLFNFHFSQCYAKRVGVSNRRTIDTHPCFRHSVKEES